MECGEEGGKECERERVQEGESAKDRKREGVWYTHAWPGGGSSREGRGLSPQSGVRAATARLLSLALSSHTQKSIVVAQRVRPCRSPPGNNP